MRVLVRAGVARAPAMSALSLTQFMFGAVALGNISLHTCRYSFCLTPPLL